MEFVKALEEAIHLGVSNEDFIQIWGLEVKLKQQKEESKALELRLECNKSQEQAKFQEVGEQVKCLFENLLNLQEQQISQLKESMSQANKAQLQAISKLMENQMTVAKVDIKNELIDVLNQFSTTMKSELHESVMNMFKDAQPTSAGSADINVQCLADLQQNKTTDVQTSPSSLNVSTDNDSEEDCIDFVQENMPKLDQTSLCSLQVSTNKDSKEDCIDHFPSDEGPIFCISNILEVAASREIKHSPYYILPELPATFYLSIWFNKKGNMMTELSLTNNTEKTIITCRIYTINGYIKNRNSGSFSVLFEICTGDLLWLQPDDECKCKAPVCLKTGSGSFDNVTFDLLESRGFIINNSCTIKWFVSS